MSPGSLAILKTWGDGNGHSHVRASMLGASLTIPFVNKRLTLGTWQQIVFVDFDNRPRSRRIVTQILGE
jgi:secondary thiamine-phosphate synthase enzyme